LTHLPNAAIDALLERFGGASSQRGLDEDFDVLERIALHGRFLEPFDYDVLMDR
jgi:hypothetical protein